jgi:REP element-mobilizing transposase RayT
MKKNSHTHIPTIWSGLGDRRKRGLRILPKSGGYFVHVTSRAVGQAFLFGTDEKRKFQFLMRQWAEFSGLGILTHCLMDNHFHLLLWVPVCSELPHNEIVDRLKKVWPSDRVEEWMSFYDAQSGDRKKAMDQAIVDRMGNLPEFMRVLKQSFSRWYNRKEERKGALWDSRYRSVVVEANPLALLSVGAYIDLNPIRAGLCSDPMDYGWSGYGAACGGDPRSRQGLGNLIRLSRGQLPFPAVQVRTKQLSQQVHWSDVGKFLKEEETNRVSSVRWSDTQEAYRVWLYYKGESKCDLPYAKTKYKHRKGFDPVEVGKEFVKMGQVPVSKLLTRKWRYFTRGVAVGSPEFLEGLMNEFRSCFGDKRKTATRPMKGVAWLGMGVMRQVE